MINQIVGAIIKAVREGKGMTQQELAKGAKTSRTAINAIENGNRNISLELLTKIADALGQGLDIQFKPKSDS